MLTFLEAGCQVHIFIFLCSIPKTTLWCLCQILFCVSVHDTHVVNTVSPILSEVMDHKVSLLFHGIQLLC